jgi:hypothetical protein
MVDRGTAPHNLTEAEVSSIRALLREHAIIPADGEEFELTFDEIVDPMEMLRGYGYRTGDWQFTGSQVAIP